MIRQTLFAAALGLSFVGGAGAMLAAYPFLFPPPAADDPLPVVVPAAPTAQPAALVRAAVEQPGAAARFAFDETAPGRDPVHWANGTGGLYRTAEGWVLRLERDFVAGAGPDFWIYLNTTAVGDETGFFADQGRVKLTRLRSFEGAQNYVLPAGIDPTAFHTVTIWCETFGQYIASGAIVPASA